MVTVIVGWTIDIFPTFQYRLLLVNHIILVSYNLPPRSEWLDHSEGAFTGFMIASDGGLSEGYGHGGPGVCLGDGQTEAYLFEG